MKRRVVVVAAIGMALAAMLQVACSGPGGAADVDSASGSSDDPAAADVPSPDTDPVAAPPPAPPPPAPPAPPPPEFGEMSAALPPDATPPPRYTGSRPGPRLPTFKPWPPPTPTSRDAIARALVVGDGDGSWGAVADRFDTALAAAGYEDRAYYAVPGGFALATRIERIDREGRPLSEPSRWVGSQGRREWTLESVLRELAGVPVGRYRTLVFVFSDTAFQSRDAAVSEAMAERWRSEGLNRLPAALRATAYDAGFQCDVLVYEFRQGSAGEAATFVEGGLSARRHLASSLILDKLEASP